METTKRIKLALQKATSGHKIETIVIVNERRFKVLYKDSLTECIHGDIMNDSIIVFGATTCKDLYKEILEERLPEFNILMIS